MIKSNVLSNDLIDKGSFANSIPLTHTYQYTKTHAHTHICNHIHISMCQQVCNYIQWFDVLHRYMLVIAHSTFVESSHICSTSFHFARNNHMIYMFGWFRKMRQYLPSPHNNTLHSHFTYICCSLRLHKSKTH